jgi:hypothetical protein
MRKSLALVIGLAMLITTQSPITAFAGDGVAYLEKEVNLNEDEYSIAEFTSPGPGLYQVGFYTDGEEVGGVAHLIDPTGGELYSIDFSTNTLPIYFDVDSGGVYTFLLELGQGEPDSDISIVVEDAMLEIAGGGSSTSGSASSGAVTRPKDSSAVTKYVPAKKTKTQAASAPAVKYAYMYFVEQDKVFKEIIGTGWKNFFGFRSRDSQSSLGATFIFSGNLPSKPDISVQVTEIAANSKTQEENFTINPKNVILVKKNGNNTITFSTSSQKIRGDSLYQGSVVVRDPKTDKVLYYDKTDISVDYKMSLGCSTSLFALTAIRDTSKGFLQSVVLLSTAVNGVFNDIIGSDTLEKMPLAKRTQILKKLMALSKAGEAASTGLELIDFAEATASGDKVKIKVLIKGKIDEKLKSYLEIKPTNKAQQAVVTFTATAEQAATLTQFLTKQGKANGDLISTTCS